MAFPIERQCSKFDRSLRVQCTRVADGEQKHGEAYDSELSMEVAIAKFDHLIDFLE